MSVQVQQTAPSDLVSVGEHLAVIYSIELENGHFGEEYCWRFAIKGEYEGRFLPGWTPNKFLPGSKLYKWYGVALGGAPVPKGKDFDSDEIVGKQVIADVTQVKGRNGWYNKVDDIKPYQPQAPNSTAEVDIPF